MSGQILMDLVPLENILVMVGTNVVYVVSRELFGWSLNDDWTDMIM